MLNRAASIIAVDLYIQCTTPVFEEKLPSKNTLDEVLLTVLLYITVLYCIAWNSV